MKNQMKPFFNRGWTGQWDRIGILISLLCVMHCLAVPLLLLFLPTLRSALIAEEDVTHFVLLGFILGVAGIAFLLGYRTHKKTAPLVWMAIGLTLISFATFFAHDLVGHFWEPFIAIVGSLALIRAHYLNHHCVRCEKEHSSHVKADPDVL